MVFQFKKNRWCYRNFIKISYWLESQSKNTDLKPRITLRDEKGNVIKKADDNEARCYLVPDSILSVKDGQKISAGDVLARLPKETSKTKDITGGLPRVAELFEARRPKDSAIIAENDGVIEFGKEVRGKQKISIVSSNGETSNYLIPKGKHVNFNQGEKIKKGDVTGRTAITAWYFENYGN